MKYASTFSGKLLLAAKQHGSSQRDVARAIGLCEPEVSGVAKGRREFTVPQLERLAVHLQIPLWQLILQVLREFDDPSQLNDYVARLADELSFALKRLQAQHAQQPKSQPVQPLSELQPTAA